MGDFVLCIGQNMATKIVQAILLSCLFPSIPSKLVTEARIELEY